MIHIMTYHDMSTNSLLQNWTVCPTLLTSAAPSEYHSHFERASPPPLVYTVTHKVVTHLNNVVEFIIASTSHQISL